MILAYAVEEPGWNVFTILGWEVTWMRFERLQVESYFVLQNCSLCVVHSDFVIFVPSVIIAQVFWKQLLRISRSCPMGHRKPTRWYN